MVIQAAFAIPGLDILIINGLKTTKKEWKLQF